eukprot:5032935-Prorocentrum_lima.AAC.1
MPGRCLPGLPLAPDCSGHEQPSPLAPRMQSSVIVTIDCDCDLPPKGPTHFRLCNRWRGVA